MRYSRLAPLGLALILALPAKAEQSYVRALTFSTTGQSQWSSGPEYQANHSDFFGKTWNESASGGGFVNIGTPAYCTPAVEELGVTIIPSICFPAISLGSFGSTYSASTSGTAGVGYSTYVRGGSVSASYPLQVTLTLPNNGALYPGDTYTISTAFVPQAGASLTTTSPAAGAAITGKLQASFYTHLQVQAFSSNIINETLINESIGQADPFTILDTDDPLFRQIVSPLGSFLLSTATSNIVSGKVKDLDIDASGGLVGNNLKASGQATFFQSQISLTNAALVVTGYVPLNRNISVGGFSGGLQLLNLFEAIDLRVDQDFTLTPTPKVTLALSNGQTVTMNVGETKTLTFPTVIGTPAANNLTLSPTFSMVGTLSNKTDLVVLPSLNFIPFRVYGSGSVNTDLGNVSLGSFDIYPAGTLNIVKSEHPVSLYNESHALDGFQTFATESTTLEGYTYPLPAITKLTPFMRKQNSPAFTLVVDGSNMVPAHTNTVLTLPSTKVHWNGSERPTTFVDDKGVTAEISAADQAVEGTHQITTVNPAPGGGTSNSLPFIVDGTPPVTTAPHTGPQNTDHHGWFKGDVTVTLTAIDNLSGVKSTLYSLDSGAVQTYLPPFAVGYTPVLSPEFVVSGDLVHSVVFRSVDNVENVESDRTQVISIDGTLPVVTYTGNNGSYDVTEDVNIICTPTDNLSGVFSSTCEDIIAPAWSFPLGTNTFSAIATDTAGNVGTASTSFVTTVTHDSLCALVERFISKTGVPNSLCVKLKNARAAEIRGDLTAEAGLLSAFVSEVAALNGKALTALQAETLTRLSQGL